jgi:putative ubiquitin-RnfH superfamily antitoxin RatB of RatAB toxin-antitoxin module
MTVEVVVCTGPRQVLIAHIPSGISLIASQAKALALQQLGLDVSQFAQWRCAVWGKAVKPEYVLKAGDRLDILRPLLVDPKEARRLRFNQQGSRAAGLFAKRRQGAKAGY